MNHEQYLERMKQSAERSTKAFLPFYLMDCKRILDVGCADSVMMEKIKSVNPGAEIIGIDICDESVCKAKDKGFTVFGLSLEEYVKTNPEPFDGILFSSVLHEISSYAEIDAFYKRPIVEALEMAKSLLIPGGIMVIRDGVEGDDSAMIRFRFKKKEDAKWLELFRMCPACRFPSVKFMHMSDGWFYTGEAFFRELMMKYTWGTESFYRESQEKVGILTKKQWLGVKPKGMSLLMFNTSSEEYPKYIRPKVDGDIYHALSDCMMTMILQKNTTDTTDDTDDIC